MQSVQSRQRFSITEGGKDALLPNALVSAASPPSPSSVQPPPPPPAYDELPAYDTIAVQPLHAESGVIQSGITEHTVGTATVGRSRRNLHEDDVNAFASETMPGPDEPKWGSTKPLIGSVLHPPLTDERTSAPRRAPGVPGQSQTSSALPTTSQTHEFPHRTVAEPVPTMAEMARPLWRDLGQPSAAAQVPAPRLQASSARSGSVGSGFGEAGGSHFRLSTAYGEIDSTNVLSKPRNQTLATLGPRQEAAGVNYEALRPFSQAPNEAAEQTAVFSSDGALFARTLEAGANSMQGCNHMQQQKKQEWTQNNSPNAQETIHHMPDEQQQSYDQASSTGLVADVPENPSSSQPSTLQHLMPQGRILQMPEVNTGPADLPSPREALAVGTMLDSLPGQPSRTALLGRVVGDSGTMVASTTPKDVGQLHDKIKALEAEAVAAQRAGDKREALLALKKVRALRGNAISGEYVTSSAEQSSSVKDAINGAIATTPVRKPGKSPSLTAAPKAITCQWLVDAKLTRQESHNRIPVFEVVGDVATTVTVNVGPSGVMLLPVSADHGIKIWAAEELQQIWTCKTAIGLRTVDGEYCLFGTGEGAANAFRALMRAHLPAVQVTAAKIARAPKPLSQSQHWGAKETTFTGTPIYRRLWAELTLEQRSAATLLEYTAITWDAERRKYTVADTQTKLPEPEMPLGSPISNGELTVEAKTLTQEDTIEQALHGDGLSSFAASNMADDSSSIQHLPQPSNPTTPAVGFTTVGADEFAVAWQSLCVQVDRTELSAEGSTIYVLQLGPVKIEKRFSQFAEFRKHLIGAPFQLKSIKLLPFPSKSSGVFRPTTKKGGVQPKVVEQRSVRLAAWLGQVISMLGGIPEDLESSCDSERFATIRRFVAEWLELPDVVCLFPN